MYISEGDSEIELKPYIFNGIMSRLFQEYITTRHEYKN